MAPDADTAALMLQWAEWFVQPPKPPRDWSAVTEIILAAEPLRLERSAALRALLQRSQTVLGFNDPLLTDLGSHRWLRRENCYSDWLAWALSRLRRTETVLSVLNVRDEQFSKACSGGAMIVTREEWLEHGWDEQEGRIDILIQFGDPASAYVAIEVKTVDTAYGKNVGYLDSLEGKGCPIAGVLISCNDGLTKEQAGGFAPITWRQVAVNFRRELARIGRPVT